VTRTHILFDSTPQKNALKGAGISSRGGGKVRLLRPDELCRKIGTQKLTRV